MPTADDYELVDGQWKLKSELTSGINQINQPMVRFDDYSEQSSQKRRTLSVLSVDDVLTHKGEGVEYLWGTFLPKKSIVLLSGEAGVGKTTFGYNLAVEASRGGQLCGVPFEKPTGVIYCDLETGASLRANKLSLIGAGELPGNLFFIPLIDIMGQFEDLKKAVLERQVELVIVDTINEAFITRDEQDNAEANRQFVFVKRLRDEAECSILLMHHIGKGQPGKKVYSARGASARAAAVDVVLNLVSVTEDTICLEKEKDRIGGGKEKLYLRKAGEDTFEVVEHGEEQEAPALMRAQQFVESLVERGIIHRFEFNEEGRKSGFSEATIGRALECLVRAGRLYRVKKGIYGRPLSPNTPSLREDPKLI